MSAPDFGVVVANRDAGQIRRRRLLKGDKIFSWIVLGKYLYLERYLIYFAGVVAVEAFSF